MLEKKRRHSRSAINDIDNSYNPPMKRQCCDYLNGMEFDAATPVPNNRVPSFEISEKELGNMVTTVSSDDMGMEVDQCETRMVSKQEQRSRPNCAKCAAGQGGHISHIMS